MGNHDYGGEGCFADMQAQFDFTTKDLLRFNRWKMPSPYYRHKIDFDGFSLEMFMLDSNRENSLKICQQDKCGPMKTEDPHECEEWFENMVIAQQQWLAPALADSSALWKIIVGHHKPSGVYADWLRPLLVQHNVQLVVGSHTHEMAMYSNFQKIGRTLLVVGAGGGAQVAPGCAGELYCGQTYGFSEIEVTHNQMYIKIHEVTGATPLHHYICANGDAQSDAC